jgi:hypothetical protein
MAWRIDDAVAHGEIDNTIEGQTTGKIWLIGRDEPLILSLNGDCWRDLAGTRLQFENPNPLVNPDAEALDIDQLGIIGDMTASRKNKVPTVDEEEFHELYQTHQEIPYEWRNTLYLEWFSEINGRVVIESASYVLSISPHEWTMDDDAENAQKLANLNSMRDFMAQLIRRSDGDHLAMPPPEVLDEYAWEERLKESDRLTDAYQEVLEKYMDDLDSEQKEAFVMGWDGLLEALAERDEAGTGDFTEHDLAYEEGDDEEDDLRDVMELDESDEDESANGGTGYDDEPDHPLQIKAQELAMRAMEVIQHDHNPGTPSYILITQLLQVSGKLAGVLHGHRDDEGPEAGFVLAVLKRCLNWLNDAVGACQQLIATTTDPEERLALEHIQATTFEIREHIVAMRRELK